MLGPAAALIGEMFIHDCHRRLTASSFFLMGSAIGASGSASSSALVAQIVSTVTVSLPRLGVASDRPLALIAESVLNILLAAAHYGLRGRPAVIRTRPDRSPRTVEDWICNRT
jgi:hypothetical protein